MSAGIGAAAGSLTGGIVGTIGQTIEGGKAADAAGAAAQEQQANAKMYAGQATKQASDAQSYANAGMQYANAAQSQAGPTTLELANMHSQMQQTQTSLQRQSAMFASVDPTLMQASQQALQLMQGQSAATVAPMLAQRAQQRQQLQQQLQQQLGPGAASSTAGAQALANFDLQTSNYQAQLQQSALGTLLGETNAGAASAATSGQQALQGHGQLGAMANTIQGRQMAASQLQLGASQFQAGAAQFGAGVAQRNADITNPFAGADQVSTIANAQNMSRMFGQLSNLGGQAGGLGDRLMGGGGSGGGGGGMTSATSGYGVGAQNLAGGAGDNMGAASMGIPSLAALA